MRKSRRSFERILGTAQHHNNMPKRATTIGWLKFAQHKSNLTQQRLNKRSHAHELSKRFDSTPVAVLNAALASANHSMLKQQICFKYCTYPHPFHHSAAFFSLLLASQPTSQVVLRLAVATERTCKFTRGAWILPFASNCAANVDFGKNQFPVQLLKLPLASWKQARRQYS